jgi:hypothetical protein
MRPFCDFGVVDIILENTPARLGCALCAVTHVGRHFLRIELGYCTSVVQDVLPNAVEDRSTTALLVILVHELQSVRGNLLKLTSQLQLFYFFLSSQPLAGLYHKPGASPGASPGVLNTTFLQGAISCFLNTAFLLLVITASDTCIVSTR